MFDRLRDVISPRGPCFGSQFLSEAYQGAREEQAGTKLHLLHNVTDATSDQFSVTDERTHESTFDTGSWFAGRVILFDLANFGNRRFALIDENDGYFVNRLKRCATPAITAGSREWRGRAIPLEGEQVLDVVDDLHREYIDVAVEVEFERRAYEGTRSRDTKRFRVGGRNEDADDYHLHITNLPHEELPPTGIATLCRCRW